MIKFDDVQERVQKLDDLTITPKKVSAKSRDIPAGEGVSFECVGLSSLRFMSAGSVYVPGFGILDMTNYAKRQLGNEIGVRWDRFFGEMPIDQIQECVSKHLRSRRDDPIRQIIARSYDEGEKAGTIGSNGLLRGFVSPSYHSIRDARVLDRMNKVLGSRLDEMGFVIVDLTDKCSHYMLVHSEAVNMMAAGKITDDPKQMTYLGLRMRNSEVGASALIAVPWLITFICSNGMIFGKKDKPLLYRQHRDINDKEIDVLIDQTFEELPGRHQDIMSRCTKLQNIIVEDPIEEIDHYLRGQPKYLMKAAHRAFEEEHQEEQQTVTAWEIGQSLARVAMASSGDRDRQIEIEQLAGNYIDYVINKN